MNTQTVLTKHKKFGMDVKMSRNVSLFWVRPAEAPQKELNHSIILQEEKSMIDENRTTAIPLISRPDTSWATDRMTPSRFLISEHWE